MVCYTYNTQVFGCQQNTFCEKITDILGTAEDVWALHRKKLQRIWESRT